MEGVKIVLTAIDFSQYSLQVLRFAAGLAQDLRAGMVVVNVVNQREVDAVSMVNRDYQHLSVQKYIQTTISARLEVMDKLIAEATVGKLPAKRVVKVGAPFNEIIKAVEEEQADILVMGTRGRGYVAGILFGSTAERVFRRCPVPLVSVRPEKHAPGDRAGMNDF